MSRNYETQVSDLAEWFKEKLSMLPDIAISRSDYSIGTDSLEEPFKPLIKQAFDKWLSERQYELSYCQMCNGFFAAARQLGKLSIYDTVQT